MISRKMFQFIGNRLIVRTPIKVNSDNVVVILYPTGKRGIKPWRYGRDVSYFMGYTNKLSFGMLGVGVSIDIPKESDGTW